MNGHMTREELTQRSETKVTPTTSCAQRDKKREEIDQQTKAFLEAGGKIDQVKDNIERSIEEISEMAVRSGLGLNHEQYVNYRRNNAKRVRQN